MEGHLTKNYDSRAKTPPGILLEGPFRPFDLTGSLFFHHRWWQHMLFWGAASVVLFHIFRTSSSFERIDVIYTAIFLIPVASIVYLNLYVAIPRLLRKERYLIYGAVYLVLLGGGALFLYLLFDSWIDYLLPGYYFISYYSMTELMWFTGSFLVLTTLLKLSRSWFMLMRLQRMTTVHQLKALHSQINPHFLLNSLQTIYALSLENSERTPEVILRLSGVLKYTLYGTEQSRVRLDEEIRMIRDYVEMYRYRVDPIRAGIRLEQNGEPGDLMIAPMLLIPFIENGFTHGLQGRNKHSFVHISLGMEDHRLNFRVENSLGETDPVKEKKHSGIGIENTRQRLELLYPNRFRLDIRKERDIFRVELNLELIP